MSEFLNALKSDLLERRILIALIALTAALLAAFAYAFIGGGSSTPAAAPLSVPSASTPGGGISPVAAGSNPNRAVAEITSGSTKQRRGAARDPFASLPGSAALTSPSAAKGSGAAGKSETTKSTKGTGGEASPPTPTRTTPPKQETVYEVSILLGAVPPGTPPQSAQLTPYTNLKFQQKLPSPQQRLLAFGGVTSGGKSALFKLVGELIPRSGPAICLPSPSQCQQIELGPGLGEELEYLPATGPPVTYQLQVSGITASQSEKH